MDRFLCGYNLNEDNPNITWDIVCDNTDKTWNYQYLSENPNITWKFIRDNPDKTWNYQYLSQDPNITWDIVCGNLDKPWNYKFFFFERSFKILLTTKFLAAKKIQRWFSNLIWNPNTKIGKILIQKKYEN